MTGSGIFNMGATPIGIYGQQPWQEEARRRLYTESLGRGLSMQGASMQGASPIQQLLAQNYASSFLPKGATLGGGMVAGSNMPSSGLNVPVGVGGMQQDWMRNMPRYQFPMM